MVLLFGALIAVLGTASPAWAHGHLKRSLPSSGAHLGQVPRQLRLEFSETPELEFTTIQLVDPTGHAVPLGPVMYAADSHRAAVANVRGVLSAGTYTVLWQLAGDDGHPVRGRFEFTIAPGAMGAGLPPERNAEAPDMAMHHDPVTMPQGEGFGAESPNYVVVRLLQFLGLMIVIGAVAFRQLVLGFLRRTEESDSPMLADAARTTARIGSWAVYLLLITMLLRLYAQSYAMHGAADALNVRRVGSMLQRTVWGWGWGLQGLGVILAGVGLSKARVAFAPKHWWALATAGAVVLAFTPAFAGHASSTPTLLPLAILADGLHVLGAGGWLGSLLFVLAAGIPAALRLGERDRGPMVAKLVNAFSPTALVFAALVAGSGTFAAWLHLGSVPALWQTGYGKTLLLKLGIVSVVALTGAYNWLRVRPTLGQVEGTARVRRSALIELVVGMLILAVTAVLVATPTAMDVADMPGLQ